MQAEFIIKMVKAGEEPTASETYYVRCQSDGPEWYYSAAKATTFSYEVAKSLAITFKRLNEQSMPDNEDRYDYFVVQSYEEKV